MTYREMLADPRWQKKRLEVLQSRGFKCEQCEDEKSQLHVHHRRQRDFTSGTQEGYGKMKRFTETNKWRDAWFRKLSAPAKLVWIYMTENCDQVGMIELDLKLLSDDCGCKITEGHLAELGDRVQKVCDDRFFIPKFIYFQYGELTPTCGPHRSIIKMVEINKLTRDGILYFHPKGSSVGALEKNHVKRKDSPAEPAINADALAIYDAYPRHIARADALDAIGKALKKISAAELLKKTQEFAAARAGQDDHYTPHPATWFNRESYYDDPNAWKSNPSPKQSPQSVDRNIGNSNEGKAHLYRGLGEVSVPDRPQ